MLAPANASGRQKSSSLAIDSANQILEQRDTASHVLRAHLIQRVIAS